VLLGQLLINGVGTGSIYALVAVGFAIVYNSTRMLHIAHASVYSVGGYAFYVCSALFGFNYFVAALFAILVGATLGLLIELCVYRPIRRRAGGANSILIVSIGTASVIQSLLALLFSTDTLVVREGALPSIVVGGASITILHVTTIAVAFLMFFLLTVFLSRSRTGTAIRALSENALLAEVQGLDSGRLYIIIFVLGSALAAIGGILVSLDIGVRPNMGLNAVFTAVVAVIIGGVGSLPGTLAGAFLVGFLQQIVVWKLDTAWQSGMVFAILIVFLIFRPNGLFGQAIARRA
jgi:branched-chain amino acid transport system permease protein